MTLAVVLTATERTTIIGNAPTSAEIQGAFEAYQPHFPQNGGSWVGPAPRITRRAELGAFITTVAWVREWPSNRNNMVNFDALVAEAAQGVEGRLLSQSRDWSNVVAQAYAPALHGPLDFWASGRAANTATRDAFPTGFGRAAPNENPVGPTTNRLPTAGDAARGAVLFFGTCLALAAGGYALKRASGD